MVEVGGLSRKPREGTGPTTARSGLFRGLRRPAPPWIVRTPPPAAIRLTKPVQTPYPIARELHLCVSCRGPDPRVTIRPTLIEHKHKTRLNALRHQDLR